MSRLPMSDAEEDLPILRAHPHPRRSDVAFIAAVRQHARRASPLPWLASLASAAVLVAFVAVGNPGGRRGGIADGGVAAADLVRAVEDGEMADALEDALRNLLGESDLSVTDEADEADEADDEVLLALTGPSPVTGSAPDDERAFAIRALDGSTHAELLQVDSTFDVALARQRSATQSETRRIP